MLANVGVAPLTIVTHQSTNPQFTSSTILGGLNRGEAKLLHIIFHPTMPGPQQGVIVILHNAANVAESIHVSGVGIDPTSIETQEDIPTSFSLLQNYPNPFNPSTEIGFEIRDLGFVSLKVYDVLGREVTTLVNENLAAGRYKAQWDATGVASGVYFYRLEARGVDDGAVVFVETKKLMLVK